MRLKSLVYFSFLGATLSLFALGALITPHLDGDVGAPGLLRFVALCLAVASAFGTWGTAVAIASVHRKTWALFLSMAVVVIATVVFAIVCHRMPPRPA